jgi:hypothetical protein
MGCVKCGSWMRTTYIGDGKRAFRGDFCFKCGKAGKNKKLKL